MAQSLMSFNFRKGWYSCPCLPRYFLSKWFVQSYYSSKNCLLITMMWQVCHLARLVGNAVRFHPTGAHWWAAQLMWANQLTRLPWIVMYVKFRIAKIRFNAMMVFWCAWRLGSKLWQKDNSWFHFHTAWSPRISQVKDFAYDSKNGYAQVAL